MNQSEIIQQIHNEFDNAVDVLNDISKSFIEESNGFKPIENTNEELGRFLYRIGFQNVDLAKQYKDTNAKNNKILSAKEKLTKKAKHINEAIEYAAKLFPGKKLILYTQVIQILEKYNLTLGPAHLYTGDIPKKNIQEVNEFDNYVTTNGISCVSSPSEPLCANKLTYSGYDPSYYICAPDQDFLQKDAHRVKRELFHNPNLNKLSWNEAMKRIKARKVEDPIILMLVKTKLNQPGFIVVSKWGLEADEKLLKE